MDHTVGFDLLQDDRFGLMFGAEWFLGEGGSSHCWRAVDLPNAQYVAVKLYTARLQQKQSYATEFASTA